MIGFPGTAGFYSKDAIIEAVHHSHLPGAHFAYLCVLLGVFVTAAYTFRLFFLVFHGKPRFELHAHGDHGHGDGGHGHHGGPPHETPAVVTVPLILLAIPSIVIGAIASHAMLAGNFFGKAIHVGKGHDAMRLLAEDFHGWATSFAHGFTALPFWLGMAGLATAWFLYIAAPGLPAVLADRFKLVHTILTKKYGFDEVNSAVFAGGARISGVLLWRVGDATLIDGAAVNGSARLVGWFSGLIRRFQTGYLYHYAFAMILGVLVLLGYFVNGVGR